MNTHESYVSLETSKLLKQAGFDWSVEQWYEVLENGQEMYAEGMTYNMNCGLYGESVYSMPTLSIAQRWLREVKNCYVGVEEFVHNLDKNNIYYTYNWVVYLDGDRHSGSDYDNTHYYEVALETSIKKALELILEKGE